MYFAQVPGSKPLIPYREYPSINITDEEKSRYTDEQFREYRAYIFFVRSRDGVSYPVPTSIDDYFANRDKWAGESAPTVSPPPVVAPPVSPPAPPTGVPTPPPSYPGVPDWEKEAQYASQEAYHEQPRYSPTFAQWIDEQSNISQALQGYVENKYSSLRARHEASLSPLTGYPTREEAREEAVNRERNWEAWLQSELPDVRQDYYGQRPADRGERYWVQAPSLRTIQW